MIHERLRIIKSTAVEVLKIWTGRTPEGKAYRVLRGVRTGELTLKDGGMQIDELEVQNRLPAGALRRDYEAALNSWALANKPRSGG